jgi:tRNA(Ile)-lysidine synthetase-like protein
MKDHQPILYCQGLSVSDRRLCRRIIVAVRQAGNDSCIRVVACSGGIDSTVLVHALGQGLRIQPYNSSGQRIEASAVYINHNLRKEEVLAEDKHVRDLTSQHLTFQIPSIQLQIGYEPGIQERARNARYQALVELGQTLLSDPTRQSAEVAIFTGHTKNDQVETRLMSFLKGRASSGIPHHRTLSAGIVVHRPLLGVSRAEIQRYAQCFRLTWCEDSSNSLDGYTRNKIRHHLVPWIEQHINPGLTKTLGKRVE